MYFQKTNRSLQNNGNQLFTPEATENIAKGLKGGLIQYSFVISVVLTINKPHWSRIAGNVCIHLFICKRL